MEAPKIRPFRHRLYVKVFPSPKETKLASGLIVSQRAREAEIEVGQRAQVIAAGPGCDPEFTPGTWVMLPRFGGTVVMHENIGDPDDCLKVVHEDSVIYFMEPEYAEKDLDLRK